MIHWSQEFTSISSLRKVTLHKFYIYDNFNLKCLCNQNISTCKVINRLRIVQSSIPLQKHKGNKYLSRKAADISGPPQATVWLGGSGREDQRARPVECQPIHPQPQWLLCRLVCVCGLFLPTRERERDVPRCIGCLRGPLTGNPYRVVYDKIRLAGSDLNRLPWSSSPSDMS